MRNYSAILSRFCIFLLLLPRKLARRQAHKTFQDSICFRTFQEFQSNNNCSLQIRTFHVCFVTFSTITHFSNLKLPQLPTLCFLLFPSRAPHPGASASRFPARLLVGHLLFLDLFIARDRHEISPR